MEPRQHRVTSGSGSHEVTLAVREYGDRAADVHVVLVHGFPDDQDLWGPVVAHLPDAWHVVTYDVRGAGESSRPTAVSAYDVSLLADDFLAVLAATVPAEARFHVAAHDWGSIAFWEVLARAGDDDSLGRRIASFTSASGPSLDHLGSVWASPGGKRRLLGQAGHSWYVWLFQSPALPELSWRRLQWGLRPWLQRLDPTMKALPWGDGVARNAVPAVNLYRANVLPRLRKPRPWRTNVPVRLLMARRDPFVTPLALDGLQARCRNLSRVDIDDGHWHVRTQPEFFAAQVADQVSSHP